MSSPFIARQCTSSTRCLCNNFYFHPCMHWKVPLLSSFRALETSCYLPAVHRFSPSSISALSLTRNNSFDCTYHATHLSNTPSVSFFKTSLDPPGAPTHFSCALVQYMFSRFSHIAHIFLIVAQFITFHRVKKRVPRNHISIISLTCKTQSALCRSTF